MMLAEDPSNAVRCALLAELESHSTSIERVSAPQTWIAKQRILVMKTLKPICADDAKDLVGLALKIQGMATFEKL